MEVDAIILDSSLPDVKGQDLIQTNSPEKRIETTPILCVRVTPT